MKIAFIGLGNMGGPMAMNLQKAGHTLSAFDLSKEACNKFAAEGLTIAASAAHLRSFGVSNRTMSTDSALSDAGAFSVATPKRRPPPVSIS